MQLKFLEFVSQWSETIMLSIANLMFLSLKLGFSLYFYTRQMI